LQSLPPAGMCNPPGWLPWRPAQSAPSTRSPGRPQAPAGGAAMLGVYRWEAGLGHRSKHHSEAPLWGAPAPMQGSGDQRSLPSLVPALVRPHAHTGTRAAGSSWASAWCRHTLLRHAHLHPRHAMHRCAWHTTCTPTDTSLDTRDPPPLLQLFSLGVSCTREAGWPG